jgi:ADP-ribose pyrophosphatase YjhB (NUDIX family)
MSAQLREGRKMINRVRRKLEPILRRAFDVYWRFSRALTIGVRGIVLDREGRVFLVRHSYVSGWHLPGGGVEVGETVAAALTRELSEEGNITVTEPPVLHGLFFNARDSQRDHVAVFVVRAFRQDKAPVPDMEIVEHGFFSPDALPPEATPGTRRRLAEVLGGPPTSERW